MNNKHRVLYKKIKFHQCPALLIQADFDYLEDGTFNGAMSKEMAEKACQLIPILTSSDLEMVRREMKKRK